MFSIYSIYSMFPLQTITVGFIIFTYVLLVHKLQGVIIVFVMGFFAMNPSIIMPLITGISSGNTGYSSSIQNTDPKVADGSIIITTPNSKNKTVITPNNSPVVDDKLEALYDILIMNTPSVLGVLSMTGKVFSSNVFGGNIFNVIAGKISTGGDIEEYTIKSCEVSNEENLTFSPSYKTENIPMNMCISGCVVNYIEDKSIVKPIVGDNNELIFMRIGMSQTNGTRCAGI